MNNYNFELIHSTTDSNAILNNLLPDFKENIEQCEYEYQFLNLLIQQKKPKKILELGVSKGGSSAIILNAIKNYDESVLFSIDYNTFHYRIKDKKTGFYVDNYPELKKKWKLYTGGLALNFIEEIGNNIDFCFIDTVHSNPGEILDILMVLPFLTDNATIVFHDTNLQVVYPQLKNSITNNLLMSTISGKKIIPENTEFHNFSNIGAIEINQQTKKNVWDIFNLLTQHWEYVISDTEISQLYLFYRKCYGDYLANYFLTTAETMKKISEQFLNKKLCSFNQKKLPWWKKIFSTYKIDGTRIVIFLNKIYKRV